MPYIGDEYIPRGRGRRGASGEALLSGGRRGAGSWQQYRSGGHRAPAPRWDTDAGDQERSDFMDEMGKLSTQPPVKTTSSSLETQPVDKQPFDLAAHLEKGVDYSEGDKYRAVASSVRGGYDASKGKRFFDVTGEYGQRTAAAYNEALAKARLADERAREKFRLKIAAEQVRSAGPAEPKRREAYDEATGRQKSQIQNSKGEWVDEMLFERTPSEGGEHYLLSKFYLKPGERDKTNEQIREVKERGAQDRETIKAQGKESRETISHQGTVWGGGKGAAGAKPMSRDAKVKMYLGAIQKYYKDHPDEDEPTLEEMIELANTKADEGAEGPSTTAEKPRALGGPAKVADARGAGGVVASTTVTASPGPEWITAKLPDGGMIWVNTVTKAQKPIR